MDPNSDRKSQRKENPISNWKNKKKGKNGFDSIPIEVETTLTLVERGGGVDLPGSRRRHHRRPWPCGNDPEALFSPALIPPSRGKEPSRRSSCARVLGLRPPPQGRSTAARFPSGKRARRRRASRRRSHSPRLQPQTVPRLLAVVAKER